MKNSDPTKWSLLPALALAAVISGCSSSSGDDSGMEPVDSGHNPVDSGTNDAGTNDAGTTDGGTTDGGAPCSNLPNPVYLQIGDTQEPVIKSLGKALRNSTVNPITIVYITSGSCTNVEAFYNGTNITVNPKYIPSATENPTWTDAAASPSCTIDPGGHAIDLANAALFVSTCDPSTPPAGIKLFQGPIQAYTLAIPKASTQTAMTAAEGYLTFGFGNADQLTPWNDVNFLFIRTATKSTLLTWASLLGVPASKWKGVRDDQSSQVLNSVSTSTSPEKTVGLLGAEIYDGQRDHVSVLAFKSWGQNFAYYPDSSPTAFDKQNIRDGHYVSWSPTVWLAHVDGSGVPTDVRVKYIIDSLLANPSISPAPDYVPLDIVIAKGLVPDCAMKVQRSVEAGDLSAYAPATDCTCYYESKVGGSSPQCADGGTVDAGTVTGTCYTPPLSHQQIINQCTNAVGVDKNPTLALLLPDGGLPPLP